MEEGIKKIIKQKIEEYERPIKPALSLRYPRFKKPIILARRSARGFKNLANLKIAKRKGGEFFKNVITRHQSVLRRRLGDSDPRLQEQKITNLKIAAKKLNGLIINPGEIFSFWAIVGTPSKRRGFVNGMLLSNGKVLEGIGGGLCQMSNLLFWLFLHCPVQIVERNHHSKDVFPDSGRVLPFGSGATILYNFVDLKIKNTSNIPLQLKVCLTDKSLKGEILSSKKGEVKYHIAEKNHCFIKRNGQYFRFNEIWREEVLAGEVVKSEKIITNFAPVHYLVNKGYLKKHNFKVLNF